MLLLRLRCVGPSRNGCIMTKNRARKRATRDRAALTEAYFVADGDPVSFREFMEEQFAVYGYAGPVPTVTGVEADAIVPAPTRWFFGQTLTLNIAKARADLSYEPVTSHADGIAGLEASLRELLP